MHKITNRWPHQDSIKIEWNLGKRCNYDCSYCPAVIHDNRSPHTDINLLKATIDRLMQLPRPVRLSFTGGEPSVHPKFDQLVNYARSAGIQWISVTTNGTRPYEFYSALPVDQLVFSLHLEYGYDRVVDTIHQLANESNSTRHLIAQIMAHHQRMEDVYLLYFGFLVADIPATVRRIRWTAEDDHDLFDDLRYHPDDLDWINSVMASVKPNCIIDDDPDQLYHANDMIKSHRNQFCGWTCHAGIESLMINWDGEVHRATCRVGGSLGNIYTGEFVLPGSPVVCDRNWCTCAADIPITKVLVNKVSGVQ
jgi:organic radical activating enzyme